MGVRDTMRSVQESISRNISFLENLNRVSSRTSRYAYRDIAHVRGVNRINRRCLVIVIDRSVKFSFTQA